MLPKIFLDFFQLLRSHRDNPWRLIQLLPLNQKLIVTGIAVGIASGISAYIFELLIQFFTSIGFGNIDQLPFLLQKFWILILPAMGGLIAGILTYVYCPQAKGHGIFEVVQAIRNRSGYIESKVVWAKTVASAATIGSGGSAGREGPIVQIGAAVGSVLGRIMNISGQDLRTLVAAGAVGGLSASFSIPLAGVFFTMEVILKDFANEAFPSVIIASVSGTITARFLLGNEGFLTPLPYQFIQTSDLIWYALLGLLCAPLGTFYRRTLNFSEQLFTEFKSVPDWIKPAIGGLIVGGIALFIPEVLGTGREIINKNLSGSFGGIWWVAALIIVGKILATSITLGSGGSGGALMPVLFIGAITGNLWGRILHQTFAITAPIGSFAVVGMGCLFASAFNAPITAIIMTFEITQDYGIILPVMFGCIISILFSQKTEY